MWSKFNCSQRSVLRLIFPRGPRLHNWFTQFCWHHHIIKALARRGGMRVCSTIMRQNVQQGNKWIKIKHMPLLQSRNEHRHVLSEMQAASRAYLGLGFLTVWPERKHPPHTPMTWIQRAPPDFTHFWSLPVYISRLFPLFGLAATQTTSSLCFRGAPPIICDKMSLLLFPYCCTFKGYLWISFDWCYNNCLACLPWDYRIIHAVSAHDLIIAAL